MHSNYRANFYSQLFIRAQKLHNSLIKFRERVSHTYLHIYTRKLLLLQINVIDINLLRIHIVIYIIIRYK